MNDYDIYEDDCNKIRKNNKQLLSEFKKSLSSSGLSESTINNHVSNIDFYINDYLLSENAIEAKEGVNSVSMFLGYWFIKKAMWASQSSIKGNATSLKKFYSYLCEMGLVEKDDLDHLKERIKEGMPEWLSTLDRYDDPSIEDVWQY